MLEVNDPWDGRVRVVALRTRDERLRASQLGWRHLFKYPRSSEQAAQNFVCNLFGKTHRKLAADLLDNRGRAGNEILQQRLCVRAVADLSCSAVEVAPLDAVRQIMAIAAQERHRHLQLAKWQENSVCSKDYIAAWCELLKNPAAATVLQERSSRAAALRQNSPFVTTVRKFQSLAHAACAHPDNAQRRKFGPHKEFVVVGSLSVLGVKEVLCSQRNAGWHFFRCWALTLAQP